MVDSEKNLQHPERSYRFIVFAIVCTLASAMLSAVIDASLADTALTGSSTRAPFNSVNILSHLKYLVFLSILTAITEELIFRGIVLRGLQKILSNMKALMISSLLFAVLHAIPIGIETINVEAVGALSIIVSLVLKFVQAFAFGIVMAGIVLCGIRLLCVIALHAAFDIVYFSDYVLANGDFPATYIATSADAIFALITSSVLLIIPAVYLFCVVRTL